MSEAPDSAGPSSVRCPAAKDPPVRVFIVTAMLIGIGVWCTADALGGKYQKPKVWDFKHINEIAGYVFNHFTPWIALPAGILLLIVGVRMLRRVLLADPQGIGYVGKDGLAWDQIEKLDASQLKGKGILHLVGKDGRKLTLDSWKLTNFRDLVAFVESHLPPGTASQALASDESAEDADSA